MKNYRKILSFILVCAFIFSFTLPAFAQNNLLYEDSEKFLMDKGIMKGYPNGDLGLNRILTRAEVITLIERLIGKEEEAKNYLKTYSISTNSTGYTTGSSVTSSTSAEEKYVTSQGSSDSQGNSTTQTVSYYFKDVLPNHWAFGYIQLAKEQGIVNGYSDGTFKPDQKIKFEELCKLLVVVLNEKPNPGKYPLNYVTKALSLGLFEGIESELGIGDYVTRGQTAVALTKVFKKLYPELQPVPLQVAKVTPLNYKEIKIDFNKTISDETYVQQINNYTVKINDNIVNIKNLTLSDDKQSIILLLENNFTNSDKVNITINKPEYNTTIENFVDTSAPFIESVQGNGLTKVIIKFSEPVIEADQLYSYTIDDQYAVSSVTVDNTQKEYTLTFYTPLTAGTHTLKINTNCVKDYAGYSIVNPVKTFTLSADTTPISNPELVSATQTEVKLKFNKNIYLLQNVNVLPSGRLTKIIYDNNIVTLQFDADNALSFGETTITFDVIDTSGNILKNSSIKFVPTIDTSKPSFVTYTVESNNQIVVEFSKNVRINTGETYRMKASDGTIYTPVKVEYAEVDKLNKVKLTFAGLKENANYTMEITGVKDYTPLKNEIIPVVVNISIADKTAPLPVAVYKVIDTSNRVVKLLVIYNEPVTGSAIDKSNYTLIYGDNTAKLLTSILTASIKMLADNKTVVIDFTTVPQTDIKSIAISNVRDLANNVLSGVIKSVDIATNVTPQVVSTVLTSKNTLELNTTGNKLVNVSPVDFFVYYKDSNNNDIIWAYPINATYDSENNKIVLTLNKDINTDTTVTVTENNQTVSKQVYLKLNPNCITTVDILGNKLQIVSNVIRDICRPLISNVTAGTRKGTIQIVFSETIDTTKLPIDLNNAVMLYKDNNRVTFTKSVWTNNNTTLVIGTDKIENGGELSAGIYKVIVDAGQFKDMNNNAMIYVAPYENVNVQ